jgi:hypothetical protein
MPVRLFMGWFAAGITWTLIEGPSWLMLIVGIAPMVGVIDGGVGNFVTLLISGLVVWKKEEQYGYL